jgi:antitoxin VapB
MPLNIKNVEVERLAAELAELTGETKTEVIRKALVERKLNLSETQTIENRRARLLRFLERDVWPKLAARVRKRKLTKKSREDILGYGPRGI